MSVMDDTTQARVRWSHLTPVCALLVLLVVETFLVLSRQFNLLGLLAGEGGDVSRLWIGLTVAGVVVLLMLLLQIPSLLRLVSSLLVRWRIRLRPVLLVVAIIAVPAIWLAWEQWTEERFAWVAAHADDNMESADLAKWESVKPVRSVEDHGDRVVDVRFSADGKTIRSVAHDGSICTWDAITMKMLTRNRLPANHFLASIRPSDGRYGLCPVNGQSMQPSLVVDLESGKTVCEVSLPMIWSYGSTRLFWLNDSETLGMSDGRWWRTNYQTGKTTAAGNVDIHTQNWLFNGRGELTEDGQRLIWVHDGFKGSPPWTVDVADVATLKCSRLGEVKTKCGWCESYGLVPGGKYFHLGTRIYDRQSLKPVAIREFPDMEVTSMAFSPSGDRYAAVMWKIRKPQDREWRRDPKDKMPRPYPGYA